MQIERHRALILCAVFFRTVLDSTSAGLVTGSLLLQSPDTLELFPRQGLTNLVSHILAWQSRARVSLSWVVHKVLAVLEV